MVDDDKYDFGNGGLIKKAFSIREHVINLELRLRGYKFTSDGESLIYTGKDLLGEEPRHKIISLVETFCQESNLISDKKELIVSHQKLDVAKLVNSAMVGEIALPLENQNAVVELVRQTLHNVSSITLTSKKMVENILINRPDIGENNA